MATSSHEKRITDFGASKAMKYLPSNVRGTRDDVRGYGYIVTLPDGSEEWQSARLAGDRKSTWVDPGLKQRDRAASDHSYMSHLWRGV